MKLLILTLHLTDCFSPLSSPSHHHNNNKTDVPADSLASFVNSQIAPEFDWRDAEWLLGEWNGPSAVKGVCRPDDAVRAVETGFTTMWVSNHGARQLETSPATIDVLPSIREAVGPNVEIILGELFVLESVVLFFGCVFVVNPCICLFAVYSRWRCTKRYRYLQGTCIGCRFRRCRQTLSLWFGCR